jgi:hypothetical protein
VTSSQFLHGSLFHFIPDVELPGGLPALVVLPVAILLVLQLAVPFDSLLQSPILPVYLLYFGFDVVSSFFLPLLYSHLLGLPVSFSPHEHTSLFLYSLLISLPSSADPPDSCARFSFNFLFFSSFSSAVSARRGAILTRKTP